MRKPTWDRTGEHNPNWQGGKAKHPLYPTWTQMVHRCTKPGHPRYFDYGGRGITVCQRWLGDFWNFVEDMGPRPEGRTGNRPTFVLDRLDNDAGYCPENCAWVTQVASNNNRRAVALSPYCSKGHEYTPENTYRPPSRPDARECRICLHEKAVARYANQKAQQEVAA